MLNLPFSGHGPLEVEQFFFSLRPEVIPEERKGHLGSLGLGGGFFYGLIWRKTKQKKENSKRVRLCERWT